MDEFIAYGSSTELPTIHVISDSVGLTAQAVARAAAAQFGVTNPVIEVLPKVRTFEEIKEFIDEHSAVHKGNTGDGRGANGSYHRHVELRINGTRTDPLQYIPH